MLVFLSREGWSKRTWVGKHSMSAEEAPSPGQHKLAGLWVLLEILGMLEVYDLWTLRKLATSLIPFLHSG